MITYVRQIEVPSVVSVRWVATHLVWAIMFTVVDAVKALWIDTKLKEHSYLYSGYTHVPYLEFLSAV